MLRSVILCALLHCTFPGFMEYISPYAKSVLKNHFKKQVNHFIYTLRVGWSPNFMVLLNHFHNPHVHDLVHRHDLSCSMYEQPLKQAQDNHQGYTLNDNLLQFFSPYSFTSRCLYSAYVLLIISSRALSTFSCVNLCPNLPLSMRLFKHSHFLCCSVPSFGVSTVSPK